MSAQEQNKKDFNSTWKPARVLDIPSKFMDNNFVYSFRTKNKEGNIRKNCFEGWEIDTKVQKQMVEAGLPQGTIQDGKPQSETYEIREMILMRMPKKVAEERKKYYHDLADERELASVEDFTENVPNYGTVKRT